MLASELEDALRSPVATAALWTIGALLFVVLGRELRRVPKSLLVLMACAFLDMVGLLMIVPLLPFYVARFAEGGVVVLGLHLEKGLLSGIVVSTFTVAQSLSAPFWGRVSDRRGRKPALLVALFASAIAYVVFGFADSLWLLLLSRFVQGAGGGTVSVIQAYVADSVEPGERARALGWLSAATNLGVALGPVLGSLAFDLGKLDLAPGDGELRLGAAGPGLVAATLCLANLAFAVRWLPESNAAGRASSRPRASVRGALLQIVRRVDLPASRLVLVYAIAIGAFQGITSVLALFLDERFDIDEGSIGWFYMYIGAISVFARVLLLGKAVDRFGEARLSRAGLVILSVGVLGMPFAGGLASLAVFTALLPIGTAFTFPAVTSLLSRVVEPQDRGLYMGLQQSYGGFARIVAPIFYGWAFDHLGIGVPFYVGAAIVVLTLPLTAGFGAVTREKT